MLMKLGTGPFSWPSSAGLTVTQLIPGSARLGPGRRARCCGRCGACCGARAQLLPQDPRQVGGARLGRLRLSR